MIMQTTSWTVCGFAVYLLFQVAVSNVSVPDNDKREPERPYLSRPNFIVMLVDDWGWGDAGINWNSTRVTPYIDRLATRGIRFTGIILQC